MSNILVIIKEGYPVDMVAKELDLVGYRIMNQLKALNALLVDGKDADVENLKRFACVARVRE